MRRLLFLALLAACTTAHATRLDSSPRPAIATDSVRVFATRAGIPGAYDEIAIVEASGYEPTVSTEGLIQKMKEEAGKLGANAIVLDAGSAGESSRARGGEHKAKSVAIYIKGG